MTKTKQNVILTLHIASLVYAVLFAAGIYLDGTLPLLRFLLKMKPVVPVGNFSLLFANIPLAVVTLVLRGKGRFEKKHSLAALVLSVINILVTITAWTIAILIIISKP